jgi:hypothetical protein
MSNENASAERTRIRDLEASEQDTFEFWLERCPDEMRLALIDVADTAFMCMRWIEDRRVLTYTASDVMAMTKMVLDRESARAK